jgi:hypothetical protein
MIELIVEFNQAAFKMARMTEAEAADIFFTENDIMPVRGKPGLLAQRKEQMLAVDAFSAQYFKAKAAAEHKTTEG